MMARCILLIELTIIYSFSYFGVDKISSVFPDRDFKRIIAVPTTSGTGSEITQYSNIVNRDSGVKQLISDPVLVPQAACLSAQLY